jgi:hypothetical protein
MKGLPSARPKLGTMAIAVYLVATPATAAEFKRAPKADGPDIITISGVIEQGDDKKFVGLTWGLKDAIVVLNSRGGYISAAINIGLRVRSHNYETRVHSGAICNSACTLIWLAGTHRHMDPTTRLGFHSAREKRDTHARFEAGNRKIAEYLTKLGTPQQVIDLQPKADPCCFNYVGYAQAKALGLLSDRSAKQQQALPTPETQQPRAAVPNDTHKRLEPGSQQAPANSAPALGARPTAPQSVDPKSDAAPRKELQAVEFRPLPVRQGR